MRREIAFIVSAIYPIGDSAFAIDGRCHYGPITVGDTFYEVRRTNDKGEILDIAFRPVHIRIRQILFFRRSIDAIDRMLTARLIVDATDCDYIEEDMILYSRIAMEPETLVQELIGIVPPPEKPCGGGTPHQWLEFERTLGFALPEDYKAIVNTYGTGTFFELFRVMSPFFDKWSIDRLNTFYSELYTFRKESLVEIYGEEILPFTFEPYQPGLLAWGVDDWGAPLTWNRTSDTDKWKIVTFTQDLSGYQEVDATIVDFLVRIYERKIILHKIDPSEEFPPVFRPLSEENLD